MQSKSEVTVKNLGTSYEFFGEGTKEIVKDDKTVTKVIDKEVIEYYDLDVERHEVANSLDYLDKRFVEIQVKKDSARKIKSEAAWKNVLLEDKNPKEPNLFDRLEEPEEPSDTKVGDKTWNWKPDPEKIHRAVVNMVTCSFILDAKKFDMRQWITKHLDKVYKGLFGDCIMLGQSDTFTEWKDFIVQYTLDHYCEETSLLDYDIELFTSRVAQAMYEELEEFSSNFYISLYMEALYCYM